MTGVYARHAGSLFEDAEVHELLALTARRQALSICTPREINVSRLLAWLLDPSEGHGLGDRALRSLLVFAGKTGQVEHLSRSDREFLLPHNVHQLALSGLVVNTELQVNAKTKTGARASASRGARGSLDVAIIDPTTKLCVAVENKFGAPQSREQLKKYRQRLEKLFPSFRRIYIFLDKFEAQPDDPEWLAVGYSWLSGFLLEQENSSVLSEDVQRTLREFREAVQDQDEESASTSSTNKLITSVAARHQDAIEAMCDLARPKGKIFLELMQELAADTRSAEGRARMALFKLYRTRSMLWDECRQQARFAPFFEGLSKQFADLDRDVKRVNSWYSLRSWDRFVSPEYQEEYFFPAAVRVHAHDKRFNVVTYLDLRSLKLDKRDALRELVICTRKSLGGNSPKTNGDTFDVFRSMNLTQAAAVEEVRVRLGWLQSQLEKIA
ncbi:PD-(D/E)XK nuclease family protein [Variovorax paradoxus]|uniref:PD-(D/E)XK nuclease family protein n=1 Tax=Variovorax paradoxus TaxID=34073 RepID=UPI00155DAD64|nr:PD-(D/E)XK nuclease family protein [Variovorax paradoxus]